MRYLLDTHTFLWWIVDDPRLSRRAAEAIWDPASEVSFSAASARKITIKAQLGRITFEEDPLALIPRQIAANGFAHLPVRCEHALRVSRLPLLRRDAFDRMLVAQAQVEDLALITADPAIGQYRVGVLW